MMLKLIREGRKGKSTSEVIAREEDVRLSDGERELNDVLGLSCAVMYCAVEKGWKLVLQIDFGVEEI